jgi:transglutaminase-like putative cysteine protease
MRGRVIVAVVLGLVISGSLCYLYPLSVPYKLSAYTKYRVTSTLATRQGYTGRVVMYIHEGIRPYATVDANSYTNTAEAVITTQKLEHRKGSGVEYTLRVFAWNNTGGARIYYVERNVTSYGITYNLWGYETIPAEISPYLVSNDYYPSNNVEIKELANGIAGGSRSSLEKVRVLFDYVTDNIQYNSDYLGVTDVFRILRERQAVCEGYSFVFATLLRSVGIPAFVEIGYSYRLDQSKGGGHAWVEAWLHNQWVAFDPTWRLFAGWSDNGHLLGELAAYDSDTEDISVNWGEVRVLERGVTGIQQRELSYITMSLVTLGGYVVLVYMTLRTRIQRRPPPPSPPPLVGQYQYCPSCGFKIPSDAVFCAECGRRVRLE